MQPHPVGEIGDRRVDGACRRGADREPQRWRPRVDVDLVGPRRFRPCFELIKRETDRHAESVCKTLAHEGFKALATQPLDKETGGVVAEIAVLPGGADVAT